MGRSFALPHSSLLPGPGQTKMSAQFGESVALVARGPTMSVTKPVPYSMQKTVYFRQIPRGNVAEVREVLHIIRVWRA